MSVIEKCLLGFYLILQSLSGTFSLITLLVIAAVTWFHPIIGCAALAAFATVAPSLLVLAEHRETMAGIPPQPSNPQPPTITTIVNSVRGQL